MIRVYWNGKDISKYCEIAGCIHREAAGGKSDTLEITLERADAWYRWGPETDDEIAVELDEYRTGVMYLAAVTPEEDRYRVIASGVKQAAARKSWMSFEEKTWREILDRCAAECGMTGNIYGMDERLMISYAIRDGEGNASFLNRIATMEGFKLKTFGGAFQAIYLSWAQKQEPTMTLRVTTKTRGLHVARRPAVKLTGITVKSVWAEATARDADAEGNNVRVITNLPAMNSAQAGRWARNLLLDNNRQAETLEMEQTLNLRMNALARVDITGETDAKGKWIIEEAEHDLKNRTSRTVMYRVIENIR